MDKPLRVLIVEDSEDGARSFLGELRRSGYEAAGERVATSEDMGEALDTAASRGEPFDVVISGYHVTPGFRAIEALEMLHVRGLDTPFIVVSDGIGEEAAVAVMRAGARDCLPRDGLFRLGAAVERELRGAESGRGLEMEEALPKTEELYRTMVQQTAESIFLVDPGTGTILEANPAFQKLLGYTSGELSGMALRDTMADGDRESVAQHIRLTLESRVHSAGEYRHRRKDGSTINVEGSMSMISYGGGEALCFVEYDVSDRKRAEEQLRQSVDALLAIYEASQLLSSTLESEEIGTRLLRIMQRISSLTTAVISMPDEGRKLRVWRAIGFESLWSRVRYTPEAQEALYEVLETGEHKLLELRHPNRREESLSTLYLPLRIREHTLGVLEVYGPENLSEGQMMQILISLTSKAASALDNARLYGELAEREQQLQELVGRLITAQEEERSRVAYDVHDRLTQMAVAAYQHLQAFAGRYQPGDAPGDARDQELLEKATDLIRQTIAESRQVIAGLRPTELDDFGLAASIRHQVDVLRKEGWDITYEEDLGGGRLPGPIETALYRIVQEALFNVRKHARTTRARIKLNRDGDGIKLQVRDWGIGFNPAGLVAGGPGERVGVSGMRERVALLGGDFDIRAGDGNGTSVTARVPLPEASRAGRQTRNHMDHDPRMATRRTRK